jgi:hypothetical protein
MPALLRRRLCLQEETSALEAELSAVEALQAECPHERCAIRETRPDPRRTSAEMSLLECENERDKIAGEYVAGSPFLRRVDERISSIRERLSFLPVTCETLRVTTSDPVADYLRIRRVDSRRPGPRRSSWSARSAA